MQCKSLPFVCLNPAGSSAVIDCTHSHIQQVLVPLAKGDKERVGVCMKQTEENVNSNNGTNCSNLYLILDRRGGVGGYVGVCLEFRGTMCKKSTIQSKQHDLLYLKRSRKIVPHCIYKYIHTYTHTQIHIFWGYLVRPFLYYILHLCKVGTCIPLVAETSSFLRSPKSIAIQYLHENRSVAKMNTRSLSHIK